MTDVAATFRTLSERLGVNVIVDPDCPPGHYYYLPTQETHTMPDTNPKAARAIADCKLRLELIETALTHPVARVMTHGAEKYGMRNWRTQPINLLTYIAAMRRHQDAIADGQWLDPDSGEPHAAHVAACCQVILDADKHGTLVNDVDYAEAGVPAGVAANQEGGAKPDMVGDGRVNGLAEAPANVCLRNGGHIGDCEEAEHCVNCDGPRVAS